MSEWDYLPTPYESAVQHESEQMLLCFLSFCCLMEGQMLSPSQIFIKCGEENKYNWFLNDVITKTSINEVIRTMLQYEDMRSQKKRERLVEIIRNYVRGSREKDL